MNRYQIVDKLHRTILACRKCPDLWKPPVPPEGNLNTKIILCGRNPGRTEHRLGRPFAAPDAPGGRLLSQELVRISLPRQNCWVTNMVCCYSAEDRAPTEQEIINCWPYLLVQIALIKPKLMVTMGKQASDWMSGQGLVWKENHGIPRVGFIEVVSTLEPLLGQAIGSQFRFVLLPTTHPGQALRKGREDLYKDFNVIRTLVSNKMPGEQVEQNIREIVGRIWEVTK